MTHAEFVAAHRAGRLQAYIPQERDYEFLAVRMMLPLIRLPILGIGFALVIVGWFLTGGLIFLFAVLLPRLIKRNAIPILMYQALQDADSYQDFRSAGLLQIDS